MANGAVLHGSRRASREDPGAGLRAARGERRLTSRSPRGWSSVKGTPQAKLTLARARPDGRTRPRTAPRRVRHRTDGRPTPTTAASSGWSGGTHCCMVEVDIETGLVHIDRYVVVEDCGVPVNPAIVEGQMRGGVTQGIGAVLLEHSAYGEDGQFLAATFMDYLMPTTDGRAELRDPPRRDRPDRPRCQLPGCRGRRHDRRSGHHHQRDRRRPGAARGRSASSISRRHGSSS